jgi:hypothetical protein
MARRGKSTGLLPGYARQRESLLFIERIKAAIDDYAECEMGNRVSLAQAAAEGFALARPGRKLNQTSITKPLAISVVPTINIAASSCVGVQ